MNEVKELKLKEVQYDEPLNSVYSFRITKSQHEKLKKNKHLKEHIDRYARLCIETYPNNNK